MFVHLTLAIIEDSKEYCFGVLATFKWVKGGPGWPKCFGTGAK